MKKKCFLIINGIQICIIDQKLINNMIVYYIEHINNNYIDNINNNINNNHSKFCHEDI